MFRNLSKKFFLNLQIPQLFIIQSDHGSEFSFQQYKGYGWENPNEIMLNERM